MTVEVLKKFSLPCQISIIPFAETCDREVSLNSDAPNVIGDSASERLDANYIVTPLPESLPAYWQHSELLLVSF
jgi:hypothetical protein